MGTGTLEQWIEVRERVHTLLDNKSRAIRPDAEDHSYRSMAHGIICDNFLRVCVSGIKASADGDYAACIDAINVAEQLQGLREWLMSLPSEVCPQVPVSQWEAEGEATLDKQMEKM